MTVDNGVDYVVVVRPRLIARRHIVVGVLASSSRTVLLAETEAVTHLVAHDRSPIEVVDRGVARAIQTDERRIGEVVIAAYRLIRISPDIAPWAEEGIVLVANIPNRDAAVRTVAWIRVTSDVKLSVVNPAVP